MPQRMQRAVGVHPFAEVSSTRGCVWAVQRFQLGPFFWLRGLNEAQRNIGEDRPLAVIALSERDVAVVKQMRFDDCFESRFGVALRYQGYCHRVANLRCVNQRHG